MIKYIVNEELVRKCVDESFNRFMIEEGFIEEGKWGDMFKGALNNGKDLVRAFMDWRTNGQWNEKYDQHVGKNNNTTFGNLWKQNNWFSYHLKNIKVIMQKNQRNPQGNAYSTYQIDKKTGNKIVKDTSNDPMGYIRSYCNYKNYYDYTKQHDPYMLKFLKDNIMLNNDLNDVLSKFSYSNYLKYRMEKDGKLKKKNNQQPNQNQGNQQQ